jgi:hypothetical protein
MQSTCRPAGLPAAIVQSCLEEDDVPALVTQTSGTNYIRRLSPELVLVVTRSGTRIIEWPRDESPLFHGWRRTSSRRSSRTS